jgi:hypothetical protein
VVVLQPAELVDSQAGPYPKTRLSAGELQGGFEPAKYLFTRSLSGFGNEFL